MKKLILLISAMLTLSAGAFAKGKYHGDIQFQAGGTTAAIYAQEKENNTTFIAKELETKQICFDISTWNMWDVSNCFSIGFVVDAYGGFGTLDDWSFNSINRAFNADVKDNSPIFGGIFVGPAFGLQLGKVAKLSLGVGVVSDFTIFYGKKSGESTYKEGSTILSSAGIGADAQLKLFPTSFFSPLIGYRCSIGAGGKLSAYTGNSSKNYRSSTVDAGCIVPVNGTLYAGFSFNW